MHVLTWSRAALAACTLGLVLLVPARAQCPTPDLLDGGPCCAVAQPKKPSVPDFKQKSLSICWLDCGIESVTPVTARWSGTAVAFPPGPCSVFSKALQLNDPSGTALWNGRLAFVYARTWLERKPSGVDIQVWRYLINGDLRPTAALGAAPCPRPPCAAANGNKVKFSGYVDYVRECNGAAQSYAWMLTHACDGIDHLPGFLRAGTFHPERSYTFVGPSAAFIVDPLGPAESGGTSSEAVRRIPRVPGTTLVTCEYEEQIQSTLVPNTSVCMCGSALGPLQFHISNLSVFGACGTLVTTPGGPLLPGFTSMGIGRWTSPTAYPGVEGLRWNAGNYDYADPCIGTVRNELFFGVTTVGGFPAAQIVSTTPTGIGGALPLTFVDQGNALRNAFSGTPGANIPYQTDHVLNLNFP